MKHHKKKPPQKSNISNGKEILFLWFSLSLSLYVCQEAFFFLSGALKSPFLVSSSVLPSSLLSFSSFFFCIFKKKSHCFLLSSFFIIALLSSSLVVLWFVFSVERERMKRCKKQCLKECASCLAPKRLKLLRICEKISFVCVCVCECVRVSSTHKKKPKTKREMQNSFFVFVFVFCLFLFFFFFLLSLTKKTKLKFGFFAHQSLIEDALAKLPLSIETPKMRIRQRELVRKKNVHFWNSKQ